MRFQQIDDIQRTNQTNFGNLHISKHNGQLKSHIPAMLPSVLQADGGDGKCSCYRYDV